jgi:hypothetical protein
MQVVSRAGSQSEVLLRFKYAKSARATSQSLAQQPFSTRSLSDLSWGKACSLMEWRSTPGRPGWVIGAVPVFRVAKQNV